MVRYVCCLGHMGESGGSTSTFSSCTGLGACRFSRRGSVSKEAQEQAQEDILDKQMPKSRSKRAARLMLDYQAQNGCYSQCIRFRSETE